MEAMHHDATNTKCLIVALENKEVRLYNEKHLISVFTEKEVVTAMRFGPFGREPNSLILTMANGALSCKILSRSSTLASPTGSIQKTGTIPYFKVYS
jgi:hypothetical protein